jgi:hypothetical protein
VPENRITRVSIRRIAEHGEIIVRAEAECSVSGQTVSVSSSGARADDATAEQTQLGELRKRLYAAGFSKRAISTACKDVGRDD